MRSLRLPALGIIPPWLVKRCDFDPDRKQLDIYIDFTRGGEFTCCGCGREGNKAYDTVEKTWRHLNFFQHVTYLHARVPRTDCPDCGVGIVSVPWAREGSGFTLLFEAFIMVLARDMPVNAIARLVKEHDTRLWRVLRHYVDQARNEQDYSDVTRIGVDETASKRGHNYISIFVDMDKSKVLFATPGKGAGTLGAFKEDLEAHGGQTDRIRDACCDMSPAFISESKTPLQTPGSPLANSMWSRFSTPRSMKCGAQEQKERPELKKTRWVWLKNEENQTDKEYEIFESLKNMNWKTIRATHLKSISKNYIPNRKR